MRETSSRRWKPSTSPAPRRSRRPSEPEDRGFHILPDVFSAGEIEALSSAVSSVSTPRGGARNLLAIDAVDRLARDPRLLRIASGFVGKRPHPFRATLFAKSRSANWPVPWHQDTVLPILRRLDDPAWGPWSMKGGALHGRAPANVLEQIVALRVHLDDSRADNGPLRVLPGSHTTGVLDDESIQALLSRVDVVECHVERGGVVAMRPLLVHSSGKCRSAASRRVLHLEYARASRFGTAQLGGATASPLE